MALCLYGEGARCPQRGANYQGVMWDPGTRPELAALAGDHRTASGAGRGAAAATAQQQQHSSRATSTHIAAEGVDGE